MERETEQAESPLLIKLRVRMSEEEYVGSNLLFLRAAQHKNRAWSAVAVVLLIVAAAMGLLLLIAGEESRTLPLYLVAPVVSLLLLLLRRAMMTVSARRLYRKYPDFGAARTVWLFDDRAEVISPNGRSVFFWSELNAAESKDTLLLWYGMQAFIIPAAAVDASVAAYLHNLLQAKLLGRFQCLSPMQARGVPDFPQEERPVSPLHRAIAAAESPPFSFGMVNRPTVHRSWAVTVLFSAVFSAIIASMLCADWGIRLFVDGIFWWCTGVLFAVLLGAMQLLIAVSARNAQRREPNLRVTLLPEGFGTDIGRSSTLTAWEQIRVRETDSALQIGGVGVPESSLKIFRKDVSPQIYEELRRTLARCSPKDQSKFGKSPRE